MNRIQQYLLSVVIFAGLVAGDLNAQTYESYLVKEGDTLYRIARNHNVTVESLRELNDIEKDHIEPGQTIWITGKPEFAAAGVEDVDVPRDTTAVELPDTTKANPDSSAADLILVDVDTDDLESVVDSTATKTRSTFVHVVKAGETFFAIGELYGVSPDSLAEFNPDYPTFLQEGDSVTVPWDNRSGYHRVARGETLYRISRRYGVSVQRLQEMNSLAGTTIRIGQQLIVPLRPEQAAGQIRYEEEILAEGIARIYPDTFEGRLMANGQPYIPDRFTVSHDSLELGTPVLLVDPDSGRRTFAAVSDRLPPGSGVMMEVSKGVADVLNLPDNGAVIEMRRVP